VETRVGHTLGDTKSLTLLVQSPHQQHEITTPTWPVKAQMWHRYYSKLGDREPVGGGH
jgi:hypothetical protein